jgi:transcriptional regulator with XRE-family HTH domain
MIDRKKLGNIIRSKRREKNLTQVSVSRITGLSRNYISDIENGRYMPSINSLSKIAICLNLDLNVLKMTEIQVFGFEEKRDFDSNDCPNSRY